MLVMELIRSFMNLFCKVQTETIKKSKHSGKFVTKFGARIDRPNLQFLRMVEIGRWFFYGLILQSAN